MLKFFICIRFKYSSLSGETMFALNFFFSVLQLHFLPFETTEEQVWGFLYRSDTQSALQYDSYSPIHTYFCTLVSITAGCFHTSKYLLSHVFPDLHHFMQHFHPMQKDFGGGLFHYFLVSITPALFKVG